MADIKGTTAVALGNFDGLHLGHAAVITQTAALAAKGFTPCALLFAEHPQSVLAQAPPELLGMPEKEALLREAGLSVCVMPFAQLQGLSPQAFVQDILLGQLHAGAVCCGYNYRFGKNGKGSSETLAQLCQEYGLQLHISEPVLYQGEPISSTRIRAAIQAGHITDANAMLGRPFSYNFTVVSGDRRGRLLGAPTINQLFPAACIVPKHGVYASQAYVNGAWHASVSNIGYRPTFAGEQLRSETCIMHFSGDLYGKQVPVALLQYLRPEAKFQSMQALQAQIQADAAQAEQIFASAKF